MALSASPTFALAPSADQAAYATNYISSFDFTSHEMPELYEREFARYGNRSLSSLLRSLGHESPMASDLVKYAEQGRLHLKYDDVNADSAVSSDTANFTVTLPTGATTLGLRVDQTIIITSGTNTNKAIITAVNYSTSVITVAFYEAGGQTMALNATCSISVYGSEFAKGTNGMSEKLESGKNIFQTKPIILKDVYKVSGSDMAQIGWIQVDDGNGGLGYLWYLKSSSDTRQRFDDYLEFAMVEGVPAETGSGAIATVTGTDGVFYVVENRGNLWTGAAPSSLTDFDTIVGRLDKQGAIEQNAIFLKRDFSLDIDDFLGTLNAGYSGGASYGMFQNSESMAVNLGFKGFTRGSYNFYKTDWKYLNDAAGRENVNGLLVPGGTTNVYDEIMGQSVSMPFLHVKYRKSATEDRRYKSWVVGGAGQASTSDLDAMEIHYLSERCVCTLGANNFMFFKA